MIFKRPPLLFRAMAVAATLILLLIAYSVRYRSFVRSLRGFHTASSDGFARQEFPLLSTEQITQLGAAHHDGARPTNSYTLVDPRKQPGVFRIGVFGCSFVMGAEAGPGQDFPFQLEDLLNTDGTRNVEVINFGVGAFGVQQSFLLWRFLEERFDLDFTIFNLYGFHRNRDNTFLMLNTIYAPTHGRFILDGNGLRFIKVRGADRREASRDYFNTFPRLDYLRYDVKTPPQLRALLPKGRELPVNPFYYQKSTEDEIAELYTRIFTKMSHRSGGFLVIVNDENADSVLRPSRDTAAFQKARAYVEKYTWDRSSLFRAPKNHPSALGYSVLAAEVQALLTGLDTVSRPEVAILGTDPAGISGDRMDRLSSYDQVALTFNEIPAGVFVETGESKNVQPFSFEKVDSMIDLSGGREPFFIALKTSFPSAGLTLRFTVGQTPVELDLGKVESKGHIGVLKGSFRQAADEGWILGGSDQGNRITFSITSPSTVSDISLTMGDTVLLTGRLRKGKAPNQRWIVWQPHDAVPLTTRGHPEQDATAIFESESGSYCIRAFGPKPSSIHTVCTGSWRINQVGMSINPIESPPLRPRSAGTQAVDG